jgi:anti-anti-sigma factor
MTRLWHEESEQALVVGLSGEIIMEMVAEMKVEIEWLAGASPHKALIVDLGGVTFMDSSGVGLLIGLRRACQERGSALALANPSPPIEKLLDMLRLTDYFAVPATFADTASA